MQMKLTVNNMYLLPAMQMIEDILYTNQIDRF